MSDDEFYEEDEPAEKIREAFRHGQKGVTRRPRDLNQLAKSIVDAATDLPAPVRVEDFSDVVIQDVSFSAQPISVGSVADVTVG